MNTKKFNEMDIDEKGKFLMNIFFIIMFLISINSMCIVYTMLTLDELQKNSDRELLKIEKKLGMINTTTELIYTSNYENPVGNWRNETYKEKYLK